MAISDLDAEIIIDGVHVEEHLIRLERDEMLSRPGAEIRMTFAATLDHASILPWQSLVVYEMGVKTLTGYVRNIIPGREPHQTLITGDDTYKRATEWFLPENLYTSGSQDIGYWVDYLCNECGLSYQINDLDGSQIVLNPDIPFGLKMVADVLVTLCSLAQWTMQVDADGVLQLSHIENPTAPDFAFDQVESYELQSSDIDTRNRVVVWGYQTSGSDNVGGSIIVTDSREVSGVSGVRNMVYAEPNISTFAQAQSVATAALDQWAKLENLISAEGVGNPNIRTGHAIGVMSDGMTSGSFMDTITDMRSILSSESGYTQSITAGRRAYRYPYWPVGQPGEAGTPTQDWEYESVIGEAMNLWLLPGRNSFYVGGWTHINHTSGSSRCWRLECRNLSTGALVWGQDITDVGTGGGPTELCQINGVYADGTGVYVTGFDNLAARWRTERYNLTGGSSTWAYNESGSGSDIAGNGINLYVISRDTDYRNGFPITSPSLIRKLDYSGNLVTAVTPEREPFDAPFNGSNFNDDLSVFNFNHINLQSDGLYLGGLMNIWEILDPTYQRYVCKYDLDLNKIWENGFIPGEGEGDIGGLPSGSSTPTGANSITSVVLASGGPVYAFTRFKSASLPRIRGIWYLTLGGGYIGVSAATSAVNAVNGNGYKLFILSKNSFTASGQGIAIIGFDKSTQTIGWQITPGPGYNGIRYLSYANKLYVCGQKNGNFYVARYSI